MSTSKDDKRHHAKSVMFSQKCLGIVLKRLSDKASLPCYAVCVKNGGVDESTTMSSGDPTEDWMFESGFLIFQDFQEENRQCYWNQTLVESVNCVEFMGFVAPGTLLIGGNEFYLEGIRSAWARRVLKPPVNYVITRLGDVTGLDIQVIGQVQFTPLPEALCLVISDLNQHGETASLELIFVQLKERFNDMIVPNEDIIYTSLGKLIKDRKIYHTGNGYFIVTPETYRLTTMSPLPERPILMTNEEAIQKLHGPELRSSLSSQSSQRTVTSQKTRSIQANMDDVCDGPAAANTNNSNNTSCIPNNKSPEKSSTNSPTKLERFGSMRLSRKDKSKSEDEETFAQRRGSFRFSPERSKSLVKDINLKTSPVHQDVDKGEKVSVFHKLFRRSSSKRRKENKSPIKYATFAAQFPPPEWTDPHLHSRATQTLEHRSAKDKLQQVVSNSSSNSLRALPTVHQENGIRPESKSKADSLSRLRDHEKRHHHHRTRTLDSPRTERQSRLDSKDPLTSPSRSPQKSFSVPRRSLPSSGAAADTTPTTSPKKVVSGPNSPQHSASMKADKRHRRAESCTLVPSARNSSRNDPNASPERHQQHAMRQSEDTRLNNLELRSDEEYRVSDSFGSSFGHSSSPPKNKVAPYRILPTSHKEKPMNNASTGRPSGIPTKIDTPTTMKCVNKLNSPGSDNKDKLKSEKDKTSEACSSHRLSTCSNISTPSSIMPPDGSEFDVAFTSITAQKILKGVSINSIDTLLEVNLAAEKAQQQSLTDKSFNTSAANHISASSQSPFKNSASTSGKPLLTSSVTLTYYGKTINHPSAAKSLPSQDSKPLNSASENNDLKKNKLDPSEMGETKLLGVV